MKFLFDLLPVVLFFVAFKLADIYVATAVAIGTTVMQVAWLKLRGQRVPGMLWASFAIIVVFGGATLLLQDETFIKWKPTVLYWLFAAVLAGSALLRRNLIRSVMSQEMQLPDAIWARLNLAWIAFFAFMGALNLYVAFFFSKDFCANVVDALEKMTCENNIWVNFKLFGGMGLMLLFVVGQALVLARYVEEKALKLAESIRQRLDTLQPVSVELVDESSQHAGHSGWREGGGTHWRLAIVSPRFAGQSAVARHRMVYQAIGELMQNPIHALAITAQTPEETKGSK